MSLWLPQIDPEDEPVQLELVRQGKVKSTEGLCATAMKKVREIIRKKNFEAIAYNLRVCIR